MSAATRVGRRENMKWAVEHSMAQLDTTRLRASRAVVDEPSYNPAVLANHPDPFETQLLVGR